MRRYFFAVRDVDTVYARSPFDMNVQYNVFLPLCLLVTACNYEAVNDAPASNASVQTLAGQSTDEGNESTDKALVLPSIPQCDGACSCDEIVIKANDTGSGFAAFGSLENLSDCNVEGRYQQDCAHGRDARANLEKTGEGAQGFDYTKITQQGEKAQQEQEWQCVLDNHTGLMWEVKQAKQSGLPRDTAQTYAWFDPELPSYSAVDGGTCHSVSPCNTAEYIAMINEEKLCGYDNWRLPNRIELHDLVHYGQWQPTIETQFFPNTLIDYYWSSSIDTDDEESVWSVNFNFGTVQGAPSHTVRHIRLVREHVPKTKPSLPLQAQEQLASLRTQLAPKQRCNELAVLSSPISRFKQNERGHIFDTFTGLIWQPCVNGLSGDTCSEGDVDKLTWQDALNLAADLSEQDELSNTPWRLPNTKELQRTIELQCEEPALNPFVFPNIPLAPVWSATPHGKDQAASYHYQYQNSILFYAKRNEKHLVHLVRDCQEEAL